MGTQEENIYDGNSNEFVGYNIDGFGNCIGAKKKDKNKIDNIWYYFSSIHQYIWNILDLQIS